MQDKKQMIEELIDLLVTAGIVTLREPLQARASEQPQTPEAVQVLPPTRSGR